MGGLSDQGVLKMSLTTRVMQDGIEDALGVAW
jgi:hypothetical protein